MARTLGLRLSLWYATVFVVSTVVLVALTYWLLATSLSARDHDIIHRCRTYVPACYGPL